MEEQNKSSNPKPFEYLRKLIKKAKSQSFLNNIRPKRRISLRPLQKADLLPSAKIFAVDEEGQEEIVSDGYLIGSEGKFHDHYVPIDSDSSDDEKTQTEPMDTYFKREFGPKIARRRLSSSNQSLNETSSNPNISFAPDNSQSQWALNTFAFGSQPQIMENVNIQFTLQIDNSRQNEIGNGGLRNPFLSSSTYF